MAHVVEFDTTIFGGLPVTVQARVYPAEPDVGSPRPWAEVDAVTWRDGAQITRRLYDKLSRAEWERLCEEAEEIGK